MNHLIRSLVYSFLTFQALAGSAQNVALTFDDGFDPQSQEQATQWNTAILTSLSLANVKAVLFVAGKRVDSPEGLELVAQWGRHGHQVANHTYSHRNFGSQEVSMEAFVADVKRNEELLEGLPGWTKRFRFPYLKEGGTAQKRDGFRQWLTAHDYRSGAVSIDASDWYYNSRYLKWREKNPQDEPAAYRDAYLNHIWDRASYYESLSQRLFQRSANHVPLLHTNAINAAFLTDLIAMFRSKGWNIVSPEEAFRDPLYAALPNTLPAGESVLWSFAKQRALPELRYPAEDGRYEEPILNALGL